MKTFAVVIGVGIVCYFTVFKWIANWLNNNSKEFPYDDECFECNRGSCIEPQVCHIITEGCNEEKTV